MRESALFCIVSTSFVTSKLDRDFLPSYYWYVLRWIKALMPADNGIECTFSRLTRGTIQNMLPFLYFYYLSRFSEASNVIYKRNNRP